MQSDLLLTPRVVVAQQFMSKLTANNPSARQTCMCLWHKEQSDFELRGDALYVGCAPGTLLNTTLHQCVPSPHVTSFEQQITAACDPTRQSSPVLAATRHKEGDAHRSTYGKEGMDSVFESKLQTGPRNPTDRKHKAGSLQGIHKPLNGGEGGEGESTLRAHSQGSAHCVKVHGNRNRVLANYVHRQQIRVCVET